MIEQVLNRVCQVNFDAVFVVVGNDPQLHHLISSFKATVDVSLIHNPDDTAGQSHSIRLAAQHAMQINAHSMTILLGDMPFVTPSHLTAILSHAEQNAVVSVANQQTSPPVLFNASLFEELLTLDGDSGAWQLLKSLDHIISVPTAPELLVDIDTPADLAQFKC